MPISSARLQRGAKLRANGTKDHLADEPKKGHLSARGTKAQIATQ